ncbi:SulP family inorganic anion transporter [Ideonella azotifigens]|uniref:SulP family inorganic anion transporter n=3 Tax=Ideonella azotifigens TaxID=513160 RepID=A0ABN1KG03_9BURK|nr:SulP family inorganic anion transporter [Ideonella azotifigens]MCD2340484.1 SulP family inorganic anion transporter [Ideonella azotifigens]
MSSSRPTFQDLRHDVPAGIVVFLVALPLCLGIANASGVDPLAGLLSGIIGGLVVALLSGSPLSVSGPAAGLVVIVVEGIASVGGYGAFLTAVMLAGMLQFGFGLLKAGRFAAYVPSSVVSGMLAAIGLLLIIKQVPQAAGLSEVPAAGLLQTSLGHVSLSACGIALGSALLLALWDRPALRRFALVRAVPAPLAVVALGIVVTLGLDLFWPQLAPPVQHRVNLPALDSWGAVQQVLVWPDLGALGQASVWGLALTLAIVASLETLLSLEAVERLDPERRRAAPDRELKAQGVGNLSAGLLGALPITAVIVRSSANVHAGARSRQSAVVHGVLLLASVFLLTELINLIPLACLATILIFTGLKLAKPSLLVTAARQGPDRLLPFVATIAGVLATDLLIGIGIGVAFSVAMSVRVSLLRPFTVARHDDHVLLTFRKDVTFLAKVALKRSLAHIPDGSVLLVDASRADFVDPDVRDLLDEFSADAARRGIRVEWHRPPHAVTRHTGLSFKWAREAGMAR